MTYRLRGKEMAFIRTQRVARLATADRRGEPHNVPVSPVVLTGKIYFASDADARKVRNLRANPRLAMTFDHYTENWRKLAGVMVSGTATVVEGGAVFRKARQALYRRYKLYRSMAPLEEGEAVIVCVTPTSSFSWGL